MGIHWQELVVVLLIVLVLFGPRRLPEIGRQLGNGIREFRDSFSGTGRERATDPAPAALPAPNVVSTPAPASQPHVGEVVEPGTGTDAPSRG